MAIINTRAETCYHKTLWRTKNCDWWLLPVFLSAKFKLTEQQSCCCNCWKHSLMGLR